MARSKSNGASQAGLWTRCESAVEEDAGAVRVCAGYGVEDHGVMVLGSRATGIGVGGFILGGGKRALEASACRSG